jgi:hypothetical protein
MKNAYFGSTNLFDEGHVPDVIIDTGTSYCSLHKDAIDRIQYDMVHKYGLGEGHYNHVHNWEHSCTEEQYEAIPDLSWEMQGTVYTLPKRDWLPRRHGSCMIQIMLGKHKQVMMGINWF